MYSMKRSANPWHHPKAVDYFTVSYALKPCWITRIVLQLMRHPDHGPMLSTEPVTRMRVATVRCVLSSSALHTVSSVPPDAPRRGWGGLGTGLAGLGLCARDSVFTRMCTSLINGLGHTTWSAIVFGC